MFYSVEERKTIKGEWEAVYAWEHQTREEAVEDLARLRAVFGGTEGCRFVFSEEKPEGWSKE